MGSSSSASRTDCHVHECHPYTVDNSKRLCLHPLIKSDVLAPIKRSAHTLDVAQAKMGEDKLEHPVLGDASTLHSILC